jgi:TatD DNase family protein
MQLIETHAHVYLEQFAKDVDEVIARAKEAGVDKIYMPNVDSTTIDDMLELEHRYPDYCIPMMGLHPCSVKKDFEKELYIVEDWLNKRDFVAVGEIGTDLYWDKTYFEQQQEAFNIQSKLAKKKDVPIVIHCRDSMDENISLVENLNDQNYRGIFHCFSGTVDQAKKIIDLGFHIGIGGVSTFKNGGLEPVLEEIDLSAMVLETDSPYLAPVPFRGKRNEPAYVINVAQKIALIKGVSLEEVAEVTTRSALGIFA